MQSAVYGRKKTIGMNNLDAKLNNLIEYFKSLGSVAIAFSSGVDSTFMLKAANMALGENVIAVTVKSDSFPQDELIESIEFCESLGVKHIVRPVDQLSIEGFRENPVDRCYICKKEIFKTIIEVAKENNISYVAEGSNMDDNGDYRPGMKAIRELNVLSPLQEALLYKSEIRQLSKKLELPTWNKPSMACLATRFPYGDIITKEKLSMVEQAEKFLMELGFYQLRVRVHDKVARIEVLENEFSKVLEERENILERFKEIGFQFVALDIAGYKTGSMNKDIE